VVCAYCGNRRDVDLQGWAHLQANDSDEGLHCPDCRGALETLRLHEAACAASLAKATGISLGRLHTGGYNPCSSAGSRPRRPRT
jgi:hypothetical protein